MERGFFGVKRAMLIFAVILCAGMLRDAGLIGFGVMFLLALSPSAIFFLWDKFRASKANLAQP
ncbi:MULTISPECIES: hypothetical protein [unclassified Pseudomonas]|uniref:hypothetical protein n=1 Tax=unclassified Pseudomonas TaxID=196821 RepID=UPI001463AF75|nr:MULTISPECIES: hypothetical protein [unclassified Pseudomonas]QJI21461.1 hypothetical protein HKK57_25400 [Pseudomonas sp. ADAK21]QJI23387.1 hypothetical protein HKK56_07690 [Pseudomonas sp. ADAK20]